ncbi:PREDICTED: intracellular protein transport protein USO1-like isoform X2 [Priapulus caudatus]|nr:PREDICTED: intracellular protein transport protein USO1-like isoform X2 [Priapulus caudatus]XP_014675556.1 PREDICTED: intracellular protein transport protein USO1-like isoform X2 [Priapulus caudatus]
MMKSSDSRMRRGMGSKISTSFPQNPGKIDTSNIEVEYIKNLQQQIYFLELEVSFLRELANRTSSLHPVMTAEAEKMLSKLRDMQREIDQLRADLRRKDTQLELSEGEKLGLLDKVKVSEDDKTRSKRMMVEEIIDMKKQMEMQRKEMARRDNQISDLQAVVEQKTIALQSSEHKAEVFRNQILQTEDQLNKAKLLVEEKRVEVLRKESSIREMEDKFYSSTVSVQEAATKDLREEIRYVKHKLKEAEMSADQERYLRSKIGDDKASLIKENSSLASQLLELQKTRDLEKTLKDQQEGRRTAEISELVLLRDREKDLQRQVTQLTEQVTDERSKCTKYIDDMGRLERINTSKDIESTSMKTRLTDVEGVKTNIERDVYQLRRDKSVLVDHVAELQQQIKRKDDQILRLKAEMHALQSRISSLTDENQMQRSMQTQKWEEFEKLAEGMKNLSRTMSIQSSRKEKSTPF